MTRRRINRWLLPMLVPLCVWLAMQAATQHALHADFSAQRINSLSSSAEQALASLPGPLTATAWLPELAVERAQLEQLLAPYIAHPSGMQLEIVDPTRHPQRARTAGVARHGELHLSSGQRREVIDKLSRSAVDSALHRLARSGEQWIVSLRGHGEAEIDDSPQGLRRLADRLEGLGYRLVAVDPRQLDALPDNTALLLIGGPDQAYPAHVERLLGDYLAGGGAALWLTGTRHVALPALGVRVDTLPGVIVDAAAAQYGLDSPDNAIVSDYPATLPGTPARHSVIRRATALQWVGADHWQTVGQLRSSPRSWNETGALSGSVSRDPTAGEQAGPHTVGLLLERAGPAGPAARIAFVGGYGPFGNDGLGLGDNRLLAAALVNWLTGNRQLAAPEPAADLDIGWSPRLGSLLAVVFMIGLPLVYLTGGLWLRAHRRRA